MVAKRKGKQPKAQKLPPIKFVFCPGGYKSRESFLEAAPTLTVECSGGGRRPLTREEQRQVAARLPTENQLAVRRRKTFQTYWPLIAGCGPENKNYELWNFIEALAVAKQNGDPDSSAALHAMAEFSLAALMSLAESSPAVGFELAKILMGKVWELNRLADANAAAWAPLAERLGAWPMNITRKNESLRRAKERVQRLRLGAADPLSNVRVTGPVSRLVYSWLLYADFVLKSIDMASATHKTENLKERAAWPAFRVENADFYVEKIIAGVERERGKKIAEWDEFKTTNISKDAPWERVKHVKDAVEVIFGQLERKSPEKAPGSD